MRLINADKISYERAHLIYPDGSECLGYRSVASSLVINSAPTEDAIMMSDLESWLYQIALNNVGVKFDGDFCDAVAEIIKRLDGLRVFAAEKNEQ